MEFRMFGPLEASEHGRTFPLGGPKQRLVLAHLLLRAGEVVSTSRLIDEVWGDDPPNAAQSSLQAYVSHLRKALGPERIHGGARGYVLHADADEIDARRFETTIREASRLSHTDPAGAAAMFEKAQALWRGPPFSDLADEPSLRSEIARLEELRLQAIDDRIAALLSLGDHSHLVPELQGLVEEHRLREGLWAHLMVALYRSGRQAEALTAHRRAREVLLDELGIDPSPELQRLHEQILKQDPALEVNGRPLRGYRLMEKIGQGAFGVVHRAVQPQVDREVAIKAIHPDFANDPDFIRRFDAEAQIVARLEHPHVVPLYDYWREPDGAYLVMRLLKGGSLGDALSNGGFPLERVTRFVDQVAVALSAAHRQGVIHRDVKPSNILFDEEGNAYLSDFGIAKDLADGGASPGSSGAVAYYLSPEEIRGEAVGAPTDIYSLGLVIYQSLTGRHPFAGSSPEQVVEQHLHDPLPPIRDVRPDLPDEIDEVIARATAKDPAERFSDAPALATQLRKALSRAPAADARVLPAAIRNPYKGLRPFGEADAADFFGRDALVSQLVSRLAETTDGSRFLAVVGPSGSGKSSLVRAGLVPALRKGALPASESWFVVDMFPGARPFDELESALLRIAVDPPASLIDQLERDAGGLARAVTRVLPDDDSELVLVVDQLEEVFTLVEDENVRASFLASLWTAARDPRSRVRVVATLRADFFDRPLLYKEFGDLLAARTQAITPLSTEELDTAIAGPAETAGIAVDPRVLAEMMAESADRPSALPLLQYALTELFESRSDSAITLDGYHAIGGVSGAIARRAEDIYEGLDASGKEAARQLFLRLFTFGEGIEDIRRRVPMSELLSVEVDRAAMKKVIEEFGAHRLLSFDRDPVTRGPTAEVAHEALLREWDRLRGWIEAAHEDVRMQRSFAAAATDWEVAGGDPSFLLRGGRLDRFEAWASTTGLALTQGERRYLDASVAHLQEKRAQEEERTKREIALERRSIFRLRSAVAILTAAALVAAGLTTLTFNQRQRAREQARIATARELAAGAEAIVEVDPERSILLAMEAVRTFRSVDVPVGRVAVEALHRAVQSSRAVMRLEHPSTGNVAYSRDGRFIITGGSVIGQRQSVAVVWDARSGEIVRELEGHKGDLNDVNFSPDGSRIITTGADRRAIVWDADTGKILLELAGHTDEVQPATFSPDGSLIASGGFDGRLILWDADTGERLRTLTRGGFPICGGGFNSDGTRVAAAFCFGGEGARVWDVATGEEVLFLPHRDALGLNYSADGRRISTVSSDGLVRVWDARTGRRLLTLQGHGGFVFSAPFSPDGGKIATASADGTARVWDAETGSELFVLAGHRGSVGEVAFRADGGRVVTAGVDGTARVWDVSPEGSREALTIGHSARVSGVTYSPDGSALLTTGLDGTARLWDESSGEELRTLSSGDLDAVTFFAKGAFSHDGTRVVFATVPPMLWDLTTDKATRLLPRKKASFWYADGAFSPDDTLVATASSDGTISLWDSADFSLVRRLRHSDRPPPQGSVTSVEFSPDGSRLVTTSWDGDAKVWDVDSGRLLLTMTPHESFWVNSGAFSPDGTRLLTAGNDGTARIWSLPSGRQIEAFVGHSGTVTDAAFSPDGKLIATSSDDNTARIWDASTGREILKLTGHSFTLSKVEFSPDGTRLATASEDGTVRVYVLSVDELMDLARTRVTRGLTTEECRLYLHMTECPS